MKTALRLIPLGLAAALALTACSSAGTPTATSGSGAPLITAGTLSVCTNPPFKPFEYTDDAGKVVGLDMDVVGEVAKDLGVTLDVKVTPFEGIQSGADLDTGNCDIVASGLTITPARQAKMDFSTPYFDADQALLVKDGSGLKDVVSLAGKRVGVQQATTGSDWATSNGLQTVQFEELGLQVQALQTGQVDAVINDYATLVPYAKDGLTVATKFPTGEKYGLGVKKGSTALLAAVNKTLARIHTDGTYAAIYAARVGTAPTAG
jgi:polar amino acid transport system substrate-binding protein